MELFLEHFAIEFGQGSAESVLKNKDLQPVRDSKGTRNAVAPTQSYSDPGTLQSAACLRPHDL